MRGISIAGNLFELLKAVDEVGSDLTWFNNLGFADTVDQERQNRRHRKIADNAATENFRHRAAGRRDELRPGAGVRAITVESLLEEMVDLENLAERPGRSSSRPRRSYSRESHKGGEAWFDNGDVGQYVRTETNDGRTEHVLADPEGARHDHPLLVGEPRLGEHRAVLFRRRERSRASKLPLAELFTGDSGRSARIFPTSAEPAATSTFRCPTPLAQDHDRGEGQAGPALLRNRISHLRGGHPRRDVRSRPGRRDWAGPRPRTARALTSPKPAPAPAGTPNGRSERLTVAARRDARHAPDCRGKSRLRVVRPGARDAREPEMGRSHARPQRLSHSCCSTSISTANGASNAARRLLRFGAGRESLRKPVLHRRGDGKMTSRLLMPFRKSMHMSLTNAGKIPYTVEVKLHVGRPPIHRSQPTICARNGDRSPAKPGRPSTRTS